MRYFLNTYYTYICIKESSINQYAEYSENSRFFKLFYGKKMILILLFGGTVLNKIYDMIIIGGGTAGMTAAIYGHRAGKNILIIEKSFFGGQIITTSEIENYPGFSSINGASFASELYNQLKRTDVSQISDEVIDLKHSGNMWEVCCTTASYLTRSVVIAAGTKNRKLGLDGEDKYTGHGLSYCATCDGAFFKGQTTAVAGGGNTALEEALYLSLLCKKVYLIHRNGRLSADASLSERVYDSDNIHIMFNTRIIGLYGKTSLEKIEILTSCAPSEPDQTEFAEVIDIKGLFVAIGQIPQNHPFENAVILDENGYIKADESCHTSASGVFAAGDCRSKQLRQLVTAASDGAVSASEAVKWLNSRTDS